MSSESEADPAVEVKLVVECPSVHIPSIQREVAGTILTERFEDQSDLCWCMCPLGDSFVILCG